MQPRRITQFWAGVGLSIASVMAFALGASASSQPAEAPLAATLSVAIEVDQATARVIGYTAKARRFVSPDDAGRDVYSALVDDVRFDVVLSGAAGVCFRRSVDILGLCMEHSADALPHVEGDTIRLHRESFLLELPDLAGCDTVEVVWAGSSLGETRLDGALFQAAGGTIRYESLAMARESAVASEARLQTSGDVFWPEDFGDTELYRVWGDESEVARRINIVLVPDGYAYADKARMETHAQELVDYFRTINPYAQHDTFLNYILVYAYSTESGTDECDCNNVVDTAMATRFPDAGGSCGSNQNRCLYYGTGNGGPNCDPNVSTGNISAAEMRAPGQDKTLIMVNTTRYGGCGGARAVYSAGNGSATEVAVHELGHSLAGLADEYGGNSSCGSGNGINVSTDATNGNWPEWVADLGAPVEGGRYYNQCVFRPKSNCEMRNLNRAFCDVCRQRWALLYFGHSRTASSSPIDVVSPASPAAVLVNDSIDFDVTARLASGASITNEITWTLEGPGFPTPTVVATGSTQYRHQFTDAGTYTMTLDIIADTNYIKPAKFGANVGQAVWTIDVDSTCGPVPALGNVLLAYRTPGNGAQLVWTDDPGADSYEVASSELRDFGPPVTGLGTVVSGASGYEDLRPLVGLEPRTYRIAETRCSTTGPY